MHRDIALIRHDTCSLAEYYRPRRFSEVIGQEKVVRFLSDQVRTRAGRSVLLLGPSGSGKTVMAETYGNALLCQQGDGDPCLQPFCLDCDRFANGLHPNWRWFRPGVTDERQFVQQINRAVESETAGGGWLVILIEQADGLSRESFNALHTRLQRTPRKTTFILSTERLADIPEKVETALQPLELLPATMPSRVQLLRRVCDDQGVLYEEIALESLARHAGGTLQGNLRDLERLIADSAVTEERVNAYYRATTVEPIRGYLDALLVERKLESQLRVLDNWPAAPGRKIELLEAFFAGLFRRGVLRQSGGDTANAGMEWEERERVVAELSLRGEERGLGSRQLWHAVIKIWAPQPAATDASLLVKASELHELLYGPDANATATRSLILERRLGPSREAERAKLSESTTAAARFSGEARFSKEDYLTVKQAQALWDAASFLIQQYGSFLNARLTLRYPVLGLNDAVQISSFFSQLTHQMRMLVENRVAGGMFHWLYVHETDRIHGMQTRLVANIPEGAGDLERWLREHFVPNQLHRSCPANAFTWRYWNVPTARRFERHLKLVRLICRSLDPRFEVSVLDENGKYVKRKMIDVLQVHPLLRGPAGPRFGAQRYRVSETIGRDTRREAQLDVPVGSAFAERQLHRLAGGWELDEHLYRHAVIQEREALEAALRRDWPGDERKLATFRRKWAHGAEQRARTRPGSFG